MLLATASVTYTASVPLQTTDFNVGTSLPKFNPALGTLTEVDFTATAGSYQGGTIQNVANDASTFTYEQDVQIVVADGATTLASPTTVASQTYTNLQPQQTGIFGPFTLQQAATATYTSGATFDDFNNGPGNIDLNVSSLTSDTTSGGGGNLQTAIATQAGGTFTVTYQYTYQPVTVSGNVYDDVDDSGSKTTPDTPIPGVVLTLLNNSGGVVATTTTAADGTYSFTTDTAGAPLQAGTYSVVETQPAGYLQGTNTVGTVNGTTDGSLGPVDTIGSIVLTPGQSSVENNFGEVLPVTVSGTVYLDKTVAGRLLPGDQGIAGVTLALIGPSGSVLATTTTAANGTYSFKDDSAGNPLPSGTYGVYEVQPAGYLQGTNTVGTVNGTTDGTLVPVDRIGLIGLTSGQSSVGNNFGEVLPVTLSGTVYDDVDRSGSLTNGDLPIPGVTVNLFDEGLLVATTTTAANGSYSFTTDSAGNPLLPGTYAIGEVQPAGYLQGTDTPGTVAGATRGALVATDLIGAIELNSADESVGNNFGEVSPSTSVTNVQRFGVHLQPTLIVLTFATPLDPTTAGNVANYQITGPIGSKVQAPITILSADYDATSQTVTLHTLQRVDVHESYRLTVSGVTSSTGGALTGSDGLAGTPFTSVLNRTELSGFTDRYGNFVPIDHGKLYPAAIAAGYHAAHFVRPANLGAFADANAATFLIATDGLGYHPPTHPKKR